MERLDIGVYLLLAGLVGGVSLAFLLTIVRLYYPRSIGGVSEWTGACILFGSASVLFSGILPLPDGPMLLLGHVVFVGGLALVHTSLRRFAQLRSLHRQTAIRLALVFAILAVFTFLTDQYRMRVVVTMIATTLLALASIRAILHMRNRGAPEYFTIGVFVAMIALFLFRIVLVAAGIDAAPMHRGATWGQKAYFIGASLGLICMMFGYMLIVSKRLRDTLIHASVYHELDVRQREERWALGEDLRIAVDAGQLELYYQPRVDVSTGRVVCVEALLRWHHPARGFVAPDRFIGIAEETGSIDGIGRWVLDEGMSCAMALQAIAPGMRVSINVSPRQVASDDFADVVRDALARSGASPDWIELELTESILIEDAGHAESVLRELRRIGVHLSLDDFGTGYSSLSHLKRLPVSCVKIDRSFIGDIPAHEDACTIARAIIGMGRALNLKVVAEGVETPEQLAFLHAAGCEEYQGFLYARPLPRGKLFELLRHPPALHDGAREGLPAAHAASR